MILLNWGQMLSSALELIGLFIDACGGGGCLEVEESV